MTHGNKLEQDEIAYWLARERVAREASHTAIHPAAKDSHHVLAELYADRAWSLAETNDHPFVASSVWPAILSSVIV